MYTIDRNMYRVAVKRTTIELDEDLVGAAQAVTG